LNVAKWFLVFVLFLVCVGRLALSQSQPVQSHALRAAPDTIAHIILGQSVYPHIGPWKFTGRLAGRPRHAPAACVADLK
jgi:hypothetical protein